jgi:hypothetical protein
MYSTKTLECIAGTYELPRVYNRKVLKDWSVEQECIKGHGHMNYLKCITGKYERSRVLDRAGCIKDLDCRIGMYW